MRIALVAPAPPPPTWGGAERAIQGLRNAIASLTGHTAEVLKLAVDESTLPGLIDAYERFHRLDVSAYDQVISAKYPAWMVSHPNHVLYLFHPLRGLYDGYAGFGFRTHPVPHDPTVAAVLDFIARHEAPGALDEFFGRFATMLDTVGPDAPDLAFPGPFARTVVHWLDRIAWSPDRVRAHFAISRTVAGRPGYFPPGVIPRVVPLPADLEPCNTQAQSGQHLFTASRLDAPKRLDLIIEAMAHVTADVPLVIAGTGPLEQVLREQAATDDRVRLIGHVPDAELTDWYRRAIAVPFVPVDEDLGLITIEAASQGTPTVTCNDSGGPTEFVHDGVTGLITRPTPQSVGRALTRVATDPEWARQMGNTAQRRAAGITWQSVVSALVPNHELSPSPTPTRRGRSPRVGTTRRQALVLASYGIANPHHGGQLRAHHLCRALARDMDVELLALTAHADAPETVDIAPGLRGTTIPRSPDQAEVADDLGARAGHTVTDIYAGIHAVLTPDFVASFTDLARRADVVILEQPFLYPLLERTAVEVPVVLNTQNVEHDLKTAALPDTPLRQGLLDLVSQIEGNALANADLVTACSAEDAARLGVLYGLDVAKISIIPNGTCVPTRVPDPAVRRATERRWLDRFHWNWGAPTARHLAIFFGSWHAPNLDAAEVLIELAAQRDDLLIVSAGHHGIAFSDRRVPSSICFPGRVTNVVKQALLASASIALNPMRTGSGTNLKLIEFMAQGIPAVSTPFGARGLPVRQSRHLLLARPDAFGEAIDTIVADPGAASQRVDAARMLAQRFDWSTIGAAYRGLLASVSTPAR